MTTPELRAEPRIPVTLHGTLTLDDKSAPCVIQNMCSKGFLIKSSKQLPVGHVLRLRCELYPERCVECTVEVRHVNRDCLGARVIDISEDEMMICRQFIQERAANAARDRLSA